MKYKQKWMYVALSMLLFGSCIGCGDIESETDASETTAAETENEDLEVIRAAVPLNGTELTIESIAVAEYSGLLAKELAAVGYEVEVVGFGGGGTAVNEALASGEVDVAFMGDIPELIAISNGIEIQAFASLNQQGNLGILVAADSGIETVEDLEGKTIVTSFGTVADKYLFDLLEEHDMSIDDVNRVNDIANAGTLVSSGEADAIVSNTAGLYNFVSSGIGEVLITSDDDPDLACQYFAVGRTEYIEEHSDAIVAIVKALLQVPDWCVENTEEAYAAFASDGVDAEIFQYVYPADTGFDYFEPEITDEAIEKLENLNQYLLDTELTSNAADIDSFINTDFLEQAEEELGITS